MNVIINADDFGLTEGINNGILTAHTKGVVTRATLMMNGMAVEHAVKLAKAHPRLKVGIHLALSYGQPLSKDVDLLVDESNTFKFTKYETDLTPAEIEQVEQEWDTQIQAFLKTGLTLDHIDSHHHVHGWSCLQPVVRRLFDKYHLPFRYTKQLEHPTEIALTESLWLDFYGNLAQPNLFEQLLKQQVETIEVMAHPAYVDETLLKTSSYTYEREHELNVLTSLKIPEAIQLI